MSPLSDPKYKAGKRQWLPESHLPLNRPTYTLTPTHKCEISTISMVRYLLMLRLFGFIFSALLMTLLWSWWHWEILHDAICDNAEHLQTSILLSKLDSKVDSVHTNILHVPGPLSRALCSAVCALSITYSTLLNGPNVSLLIYFILYYLTMFFFVF